jgi:hypothetical protein
MVAWSWLREKERGEREWGRGRGERWPWFKRGVWHNMKPEERECIRASLRKREGCDVI